MLKDTAPVHVIDTRAQADALIMAALEELQVLDVCAEQDVRLTFFLFPTDDTEITKEMWEYHVYAEQLTGTPPIVVKHLEKVLAIPDAEFEAYDDQQRSNFVAQYGNAGIK